MTEDASRANSFDLLRLLAAIFVFWSHQFALLGLPEPIAPGSTGTYGGLGLYIFFAISGYLNTASLLTSRSARVFLVSRALRIYPALLACILAMVVTGAAITHVPLGSYLASYETHLFILKNATLLAGAAQHLPGVFTDNPAQSAVNGSLWTLPYEIHLYIILAVMMTAVRFRGSIVIFLLGLAIVGMLVLPLISWMPGQLRWLALFSVVFFAGATLATLERSGPKMFRAGVAIGIAAMFLTVFVGKQEIAACLAIPLLAVGIGRLTIPRPLRPRLDLSLGIYVYAFPVQQLVVRGTAEFWTALPIAAGLTAMLAYLSARLVEAPAIRAKRFLKGTSEPWLLDHRARSGA
jgi:peptidoglycan/LPS O-acetylase OafA/YrhL